MGWILMNGQPEVHLMNLESLVSPFWDLWRAARVTL
jgi:hypothetical protein